MPIQRYEQRPPGARAVQFDGANTAELAELSGLEVPEPATGGEGDSERAQGLPTLRLDLNNWGPEYATVVVAGDYLVRHDSGALVVVEPAAFPVQFRAEQ